jgi:AcrR family transcriptional regulator
VATKAEQSEITRQALIDAARRLFAERGFADTPTEAIVQAAGVTRGALYHHFEDKTELFAAVFERIEQEVVARLADRAPTSADPLTVLQRGIEIFLDECLDPAIRRIALIEAPGVLGWERWRAIEQTYGLGLARFSLQAAMDAGVVRRLPVEPLSYVLFGGLLEAGLWLAAAEDRKAARKEISRALAALLEGLRVP